VRICTELGKQRFRFSSYCRYPRTTDNVCCVLQLLCLQGVVLTGIICAEGVLGNYKYLLGAVLRYHMRPRSCPDGYSKFDWILIVLVYKFQNDCISCNIH
jgi:hypothetical protein